jgi:uncharacterized OB-fold protein
MPELSACPSCGRHSLRAETCCPYCGTCTKSGRTAAATLVGLVLAAGGCTDKSGENTEPAYGEAIVDTGDTGDTAED